MSDIQRDREERQHVIEVLQNMVDRMEEAHYIVAKPERRHALLYAIASIETDLKYDLLYEETSGQADKQADKTTTKNDLSSGLEKNSKKLEKDFGELDCISRADAIHAVSEALKRTFVEYEDIANKVIGKLSPSNTTRAKMDSC